jgi:hypothetical protein
MLFDPQRETQVQEGRRQTASGSAELSHYRCQAKINWQLDQADISKSGKDEESTVSGREEKGRK